MTSSNHTYVSQNPRTLRLSTARCMMLALSSLLATVSLASNHTLLPPRDTLYYTEPPTSEEIGQHLFPDESAPTLTRSIRFTEESAAPQSERSVGMPILFHFGKTTIVEQSQPFLDSVGQMLTSAEYADRTLVVEGHTDAVGSKNYNQRLSELRALAIKDYLVRNFSIDPYRLFPIGKGEESLFLPENPDDAKNRRVEFLPYAQNQ